MIGCIRDFSGLIFTPFQNRTGRSKLKLLLIYAIFAMASRINNKVKRPELRLKSNVWKNYSKFLFFQINYIKTKYWAKTPLILAVTGGYANNLQVHPELYAKYKIKSNETLAEKYATTFSGFSTNDYLLWLTNYQIIIDFWSEKIPSSSKSISAVAEIGPGFMPLGCQSLLNSNLKFYSYDTFEMQIIQEKIACEIIGNSTNVKFIPTNLSMEYEKPLEIPKEKYCVYALWSFTEIEILDRNRFIPLLKNSQYSIIVSNTIFEGTNNHHYLNELALSLEKRSISVTLEDVLGSQIPQYMKQHRIFLFM